MSSNHFFHLFSFLKERMYHINDGLAGSFAYFLGINKQYIPQKLINGNEKCHPSSIWGPTCASGDRLLNDCNLPEVNIS